MKVTEQRDNVQINQEDTEQGAAQFKVRFYDPTIEKEYIEYMLEYHTNSIPKLSKRLKQFCLYFYSIAVIMIFNQSISYATGEITGEAFGTAVGILSASIGCLTFVFIISGKSGIKSIMRNHILALFYTISVALLVLLDNSILGKMYDEDLQDSIMSGGYVIAAFMCVPPLYVCNTTLSFLGAHSLIIFFYLTFSLVSDKLPLLVFSESLILLAVFLINGKRFWNLEKELRTQFAIEIDKKDPSSLSFDHDNTMHQLEVNSSLERIVKWLTNSLATLSEAYGLITASEIRRKIRAVSNDIGNARNSLLTDKNIYVVEANQLDESISEQDRMFIVQQFIQRDFDNKCSERPLLQAQVFPESFKEYGYEEITAILGQIGRNWNFDIFFIRDCTHSPLAVTGKYFFVKYQLQQICGIQEQVYVDYFREMEQRYSENPYHNSTHAADVLCSAFFMYVNSKLFENTTQLELVGSVIACLGHDVGHPAYSNRFLVNNRDNVAMVYNDTSVLEMMHCAITYEIMKDDSKNILQNLKNDDWVTVRKVIIDMILSTDLAKHFDIVSKFRATYLSSDVQLSMNKTEVRTTMFQMAIKCADIGHAAKALDLH